ncbi:hypothetical protein LTR37_008471 [Vermiconidia calcicola]|uniref:Uncharacterized protein n=1 Tax=Vermiconidia calcicola TaxID=1690605 RepID=A0ACC3NBT3_9PEZI|nr:hypothetical protein LTR37_008471 [Vermiconidia calcicola]
MSSNIIKHQLTLDPANSLAPTRSDTGVAHDAEPKEAQPVANSKDDSTGTLRFIGTATTILQWAGINIMTDPNFLHAGDHVHLGPGVTGTRLTNPAVELEELPAIHAILLTHYHADHFDQKVEEQLRRDLPIVTTPHAREHLADKKTGAEKFEQVYGLDRFENAVLNVKSSGANSAADAKQAAIKVTAMPGKHVPPGPLGVANDILGAVPPVNGWMLELGQKTTDSEEPMGGFNCGYRIYISGDTLMIDDLHEIPKLYGEHKIDLMLIHLGGTTIPGPNLPLLMVTMDAKQGVQLMQLINADLTIPIHFDDYDVFQSPRKDFEDLVRSSGLEEKVKYLDRGEQFEFELRK